MFQQIVWVLLTSDGQDWQKRKRSSIPCRKSEPCQARHIIWSETEACVSLDCKKFWCKPWIISYGYLYPFEEDCKLIKRNQKLQSQSVSAWHTHSPRRRKHFILRDLLFFSFIPWFFGIFDFYCSVTASRGWTYVHHRSWQSCISTLYNTFMSPKSHHRLALSCFISKLFYFVLLTQKVSNFVKYLFVIKITSEKELE